MKPLSSKPAERVNNWHFHGCFLDIIVSNYPLQILCGLTNLILYLYLISFRVIPVVCVTSLVFLLSDLSSHFQSPSWHNFFHCWEFWSHQNQPHFPVWGIILNFYTICSIHCENLKSFFQYWHFAGFAVIPWSLCRPVCNTIFF